ncbi:MAG: xanthine dehydrogenase family protein subunit M [Hadesarchaea archaeon]|nr:xanthine dehydrogenase family protein subunit M [Hadesarchaea archaeon]
MIPKFDYFRPKTTEELVNLLAKYGEDAKMFVGGTDLLVLMRDKLIRPKYVIDLKGIEELHEFSYDEKRGLRIGATVTLNELLESDVVKERFGVLWSAAGALADPTIRNRGTLVGNICNASPAADTAPALLVLDAEVEVAGKGGERTIPIRDFFMDVKRTSLKPEEFVKAVRIPNPPAGAKGGYYKWGRTRGEDLAVVGVAALVVNSGKRIVRVALSSVFKTPLRVPEVEKVFEEEGPLDEQIERAVSVVQEKIAPITDVRGGKEYRLHMAGVLTRRALKELFGGS